MTKIKNVDPHKLLLAQVLKPIVRVGGRGSGVLVHSEAGLTLVITSAHVVEDDVKDEKKLDETPFIVVDRYKYDEQGKMKGYYRCQSELVAYDRTNDMAILRLRDDDIETNLANLPNDPFIQNLHLFDDVYVAGCSLGGFPVPSKGILSALNAEFDNKEYWMSSAPIIFGNSGGGCFVYDAITGTYRLMGIPTAILCSTEEDEDVKEASGGRAKEAIPHLNYIVPAYRILNFIGYVVDKLKNVKEDLEDDR
jgi:S1-C subfamily serine protease